MFAVFNKGKVDTQDDALLKFILQACECSQRNSVVWGGMYRWTDVDFTKELREVAMARQLHLHLIAGDEHTPLTEVPDSVRAFFQDNVSAGGLFMMDPDGKKNHAKWLMFENLDFQQLSKRAGYAVCGSLPKTTGPALYVATGHPTKGDRNKDNAAVLIPASKVIVKAVIDFYKLLLASYTLTSTIFVGGLIDDIYNPVEDERFKLYLYPRSPIKDTVLGILKNIEPKTAPSIRLVSPRWRASRKAIAEELVNIFNQNPNAKIEFAGRGPMHFSDVDEDGEQDPEMALSVEKILRKGCVRHFQKPYGVIPDPPVGGVVPSNSGALPSSIHSKYFQIDGSYVGEGGFRPQKLTWIGSPNFTGPSINKSWEMLLKLKNEPGAFKMFNENFDYLKRTSCDGAWPVE